MSRFVLLNRKWGMNIMVYLGIAFFLVIIAVVVLVAVVQSRHTFACGNCGQYFRPKWTQMIGEFHVCDEHLIECPHCHIKNMCTDKGKQ